MQKKEASDYSGIDDYRLIDGIYQLQNQVYNFWFEQQYSTTDEPWSYSRRGGELFRHLYTIERLRSFCPHATTILELGCSLGLMTAQFIQFVEKMYAADVSLSAVKACKQKCDPLAQQHKCEMHYYVTTTPGLPFASDSFQIVTLCDGLIGWWFTEEQKKAALHDVYRVLQKGGYAVFTDYATPDRFGGYIDLIKSSNLTVVDTAYIYDRPWYMLESLVKKLPGKALLEPFVASSRVAKVLHKAGGIFGTAAARHIIIIAQKE